jgi:50S ribosomal protein L16 3-hydroxylase
MRSTELRPLSPLGGTSAAQFMRRYWQKSPHLIRGAIPGFPGIIDRKALFALAGRDDVESRLIVRRESKKSQPRVGPRLTAADRKTPDRRRNPGSGDTEWTLDHGPFRAADFKSLPSTDWTLLVQGIDLHIDAGAALLQQFDFIPYARLDDLMISYAVPGGGVGPHFDSYDVFLLQGPGTRRWRISNQQDLRLQPGVPLKLLSHFEPSDSWDLAPGDMLYLPPSIAHDGVAVTECMTYSIGFRAPTDLEIANAFLQYLPEHLDGDDRRYADPALAATEHPGKIGPAMQRHLAESLRRAIRWTPDVVAEFIGCMLSEPKPGVFLERPESPLSLGRFARAATRSGIRLDRRTRMLYDRSNVFVNGETFAQVAGAAELTELADRRSLDGAAVARMSGASVARIHDAYLNGALHVGHHVGQPTGG